MSDRRAALRRGARERMPTHLPSSRREALRGGDPVTVQAFRNFLSWGIEPPARAVNVFAHFRAPAPPAWYAYALGHSLWCPPIGEW